MAAIITEKNFFIIIAYMFVNNAKRINAIRRCCHRNRW